VALITVNEAVAQQVKDVPTEVANAVARVNSKLAPFEQIRRWRILDREFSIEAGELTATLKVRRAQALKAFSGELAELYD
jgi:long-chain acyl-CoA synthetase